MCLVLPDFKTGDRVKFDAEGKIVDRLGCIVICAAAIACKVAVFIRAHLDKADFHRRPAAAGATFSGARESAREAKFACDRCDSRTGFLLAVQGIARSCRAPISSARSCRAHRSQRGAAAGRRSLDTAQLQGASLDAAQMQGASFQMAQLRGASLDGAQLQGAAIHEADLQGSSLSLSMSGEQMRQTRNS